MEEARILLELRQYYASWTKIINCYIIPVVAVIIVISSTFVIMVYYKEYRSTENNIRKVACIMYAAISFANVTSVAPKAIFYLYAFTHGNITHFIPFKLCWIWYFMNQVTTIPHTASICLVSLLSLQRYMIITCPFSASKKWTVKRTVLTIVIVWILSILFQITSMLGFKFTPSDIECQRYHSNNNTCATCYVYFADWLQGHGETLGICNIITKFLVVLLPSSVTIIYCNISLLLYLREITKVHQMLTKMPKIVINNVLGGTHSRTVHKHHQDKPHIVLIVVLSSIVFVVDIPYVVLMCIKIYYLSVPSAESMEWFWIGPTRNVADLTLVCSYPALFILSCMISYRFRVLFWNLFKRKETYSSLKKGRYSRTDTVTNLPFENGKRK